jgi:hypothetical protein
MRLTLYAISPIGINVKRCPIHTYTGKPGGWGIPRTKDAIVASAESPINIVGAKCFMYTINVKKKRMKLTIKSKFTNV